MNNENVMFEKDGIRVIVGVTPGTFKEDMIKQLTKYTSPTSKQNWGDGPKPTKIYDLLRVSESLNFSGYIYEGQSSATYGSGNYTETYSNAHDKKKALKTMFKSGGVFTVYIGTDYIGATQNGVDSYECNTDKNSITRLYPQDINDSEAVYSIIVNLIIGEDM